MNERILLPPWVLLAIALAAAGLVLSDGLLVGVIVAAPLVGMSYRYCRQLDRRYGADTATVFLLAVLLRWLVATGIHYFVYNNTPGLFSPDEIGYDTSGRWLANWLGGYLPERPDIPNISLVWLTGLAYYVFGQPVPMLLKLVNGVAGGWSAVLVVLIALRVYPPRAARLAGLLAAAFPSVVLWGSLLTKDNFTLLGVEVSLYFFLRLREQFAAWKVVAIVAGMLLVATNRAYEVTFVIAGILGSMVVDLRKHPLRNFAIFLLVSTAALVVVRQTDAFGIIAVEGQTPLERMNQIRSAYLDAGSAVDATIVDTSTTGGSLLWLPIGLVYFFLAPIPFAGKTAISLAASPEQIAWYLLLPSLARGLRKLARGPGLLSFAPLLLFSVSASVGWAMAVGNVGSMFRYRGQMLFVPLILIAGELSERRRSKWRIRTERLTFPAAPPPPTRATGPLTAR